MPRVGFDALNGVALLGELARLTAPPAGFEEICHQGLALIGRALGARGGVCLLRDDPARPLHPCCRWGTPSLETLAPAEADRLLDADPTEEPVPQEDDAPRRLALAFPPDCGVPGGLVLEDLSIWDESAHLFVRSAIRTLAASLRATHILRETYRQGELLARRNTELEVLRELSARLQELQGEGEMLQAALDLVLDRLGLQAGWIFWGESNRGQLELAACRGIADEFVHRARESGIGACLCQDVFKTGRLRYARNTTECPRLPELVRGSEPMTHACIPLKFERGILGVMNIANRPGHLFTPEELQFLETVGSQVCLAVDKARTARAEIRSNAEARALAALARAIGGSLDEKRVLSAVGDYTRQLLAADRCAIFLGDQASSLTFAHLSGREMAGLEVGRLVDLAALGSKALVGVLEQKTALVVENAFEDPRGKSDLARRWEIGSAIILPLISHLHLGGLLCVSRSRPSVWSEDEADLAEALAGQAAVAIESARLYRQAQESFLKLQQAQEGMMRSERMAAVGTLASSLAHEVRNPLNSINLQLVLLSRRLGKRGGPGQGEFSALLDTARREIARLDGLVEEFLSLSTLDRLLPSALSPRELILEVLDLMAPLARSKNISVTDDLAADLPAVPMDREKMKQVLINLVRNAIEAMPNGGSLTLAARRVGGSVSIDVADTGSGIPEGLDVFDFFVTTKQAGTGLGLPIARRIVEAHGGSLNFQSEPGRGTRFTVTMNVG